jgi:hypothetical protein
VEAALALGAMIRARGIDTAVGETNAESPWGSYLRRPGSCLSACVYALVGGKRRFINSGDTVGVHQTYDPQALLTPYQATHSAIDQIRSQSLFGRTLAHLQQMGIDPRLLTLATQTAPTDMLILTPEMLVELGIDNVSTLRQSAWALEPSWDGVVAEVETQRGGEAARHLTLFWRVGPPYITFWKQVDEVSTHDLIAAIRLIELALDDEPMRVMTAEDADVMAWGDGTYFYRRMALRDAEWGRIRSSTGGLRVSIELPGVYGYEDGAAVSLAGAGPFLDAAHRNCL